MTGTTAPITRPAPTSTERFVDRHPVATFLAVGLPLVAVCFGVVLAAQAGVIPGAGVPARIGIAPDEAAGVMIVLAILATALGVTAVRQGRDGVHDLLARATRWRVPLRWWLVALLAMPVGTLVIAMIFRVFLGAVARGSGSVLLAAVAHTSFNRSNNADGLAADILSGPNRPIAAPLTVVVLAVVLGVVTRRRAVDAHPSTAPIS
jgi:hypothetical protein